MASPLWISHRGYKRDAVENTVEAFRAAVREGFTALETDLRLSADGHIVLHHDPDLRRLAGVRRPVASLTRVELEAIRLGPSGGARLLFFDQFLSEFPGCTWTFDIKPETGQATLRTLDRLAREQRLTDWLVANAKFVTWSPADEALARELFPRAVCYAREPECWRVGLCLLVGATSYAGIRRGRIYALPPRFAGFSFYKPQHVQAVRARGGRVLAFLPETDDDARDAVVCGVDEVLTNGLIIKS